MWLSKGHSGKKPAGNGLVAVAIDKDKTSQYALKWAIEHLLTRGHPVILIHVIVKSSSSSSSYAAGIPGTISDALAGSSPSHHHHHNKQAKDLFLTFRCFCTRKDIPCLDVTLEDTDVVKALVEYVNYAGIQYLVLGASKGGFIRKLKHADVPASVSKAAPDFCNVYVISKGKVSSARDASRSAPTTSPLNKELENLVKEKPSGTIGDSSAHRMSMKGDRSNRPRRSYEDKEHSTRSRRYQEKPFNDLSDCDTDISFVSSGRPSVDRMSLHYDIMDPSRTSPRMSSSSDVSYSSLRLGNNLPDMSSLYDFSFVSQDSGRTSCSSHATVNQDEVEYEIRRMRSELQRKNMDLSSTCKEALDAKQKAMELQRARAEEDKRSLTDDESTNSSTLSMESRSDAAKRIATREAQRRLSTEMKTLVEDDMDSNPATRGVARYRRYTIDEIEIATEYFTESRKIGEGGYGPVYKCYLDHTPVAVKVLRPDAAQGRLQFQQEVEVLSCIRHPNLVLLLGACPEYGCLVYEYMARGSLDDCLFCKGNTPPLCWQIRFRIAAEVATALHFLHQTKPEPLVHRDLKPANILLDQNFVSKISDVGLARLVPPTVADNVTQYRMTSTAGTFCYIDPEYQQTGMLGVKSDVYSLGILLLQVITAKAPMGLAFRVSEAIDNGTFQEILDPAVPNWPEEEVLSLAKIAVQCAELRRKDRPDLGKVVLAELARLRDIAEESMMQFMFYGKPFPHTTTKPTQEVLSDPLIKRSGDSSSKPHSTASSTSSSGVQSISEPKVE